MQNDAWQFEVARWWPLAALLAVPVVGMAFAFVVVSKLQNRWDGWLDGLLRGSWDGDTLCVAEEGFSCRLTFVTVDDNTTLIRAKAEKTYSHQNTALLQLQFRLHDGAPAGINGDELLFDLSLDADKMILIAFQ